MALPWIDGILTPPHAKDGASISDANATLQRLRQQILANGIPDEQQHGDGSSSRSIAWKVLLDVVSLDADDYLRFVQLGPSVVHDKIANDTFRTLATDTDFQHIVGEDMLLRLLDALAWKRTEGRADLEFTYVQGMNVLAAPFLYVMPSELEAFACFSAFIDKSCPLYIQPTLEGVHRGIKLVDQCLETVDPELYTHFQSKGLSAQLYAFAPIMTFSAGTPPLEEVLKLWDFFLAFGVHLNVLCVVAQLHLIRAELLEEASPMKLLRAFPPLDATSTLALCRDFVKKLPAELYDRLARHPWDSSLQVA